jgi:hypothetical protein
MLSISAWRSFQDSKILFTGCEAAISRVRKSVFMTDHETDIDSIANSNCLLRKAVRE